MVIGGGWVFLRLILKCEYYFVIRVVVLYRVGIGGFVVKREVEFFKYIYVIFNLWVWFCEKFL